MADLSNLDPLLTELPEAMDQPVHHHDGSAPQEAANVPVEDPVGAEAGNVDLQEGDDENSNEEETRSFSNLEENPHPIGAPPLEAATNEHQQTEQAAIHQRQGQHKRKQNELQLSESECKRSSSTRMCTLPTLPVELQKRILCFLGNAPDLLHCEQTCRGLYQVIHNNDNAVFWKNCPGATDIYNFQSMSHRERACVHKVLCWIRKEQKKTDNILGSCLGMPLWVALIDHLVKNHLYLDDEDDVEIRFHVRGDASFVLMELVQRSFINHFELANRSLLNAIEDSDYQGKYPVLSGKEFAQQVGIQTSNRLTGIMSGSPWQSYPSNNELQHELATHVAAQFPQLTMTNVEKMMRRLSLRAGVAKLSNEVYQLAWANALGSIMAIITSACKQSFEHHRHRREYNKKTVLGSHQSIRDVAPFPYYSVDDETDELNFVLVPKQLEEVTFLPSTSTLDSSQFHWHARVYGDGWHFACDSNRKEDMALAEEQAILRAQELYDFSQHGDDNDDDDDIATEDDEMILPHTDENAIILIVEDRLWFDDRALIIEALKSLNELVYSMTKNETFDDNRKVVICEGAPLAIVQAMRRNEESRLTQLYACKALANIAVCKLDHTRRDIIESGGVKACIRAMARFQDSPALQSTGCRLIGNMWWYLDARKAVANAEALTAVVNAMNKHNGDGRVEEYGCYALFALLHCESSWAEATVNIGCIDAVIDSMEKHRDNATVQKYGCQFLYALAKSHDDYRNRIIDAKGLTAVVEARRIHKDNAALVRVAENANKCLSSCKA